MDHPRSSGVGGGGGGGPPEIRSARVAKSPLLSDRSAAATLVDGSDGQAAARSWHDGRRPSPDKVSRDSGVPSPSDAGSVTTDSGEQAVTTGGMSTDKDASFVSGAEAPDEKPNGVAAAADPAPSVETAPASGVVSSGQSSRSSTQLAGRPVPDGPAVRYSQPSRLNGGPLPVKAELVTNELDPTFSGE
jgi:hypothetical protein